MWVRLCVREREYACVCLRVCECGRKKIHPIVMVFVLLHELLQNVRHRFGDAQHLALNNHALDNGLAVSLQQHNNNNNDNDDDDDDNDDDDDDDNRHTQTTTTAVITMYSSNRAQNVFCETEPQRASSHHARMRHSNNIQ